MAFAENIGPKRFVGRLDLLGEIRLRERTLAEIFSYPGTVQQAPADSLLLYAKLSGAVSKPFYIDEAGDEFGFLSVAASGGTAGHVAFWESANVLGGDASLFWDDTNKRLGLGTSTPATQLELSGVARVGGLTASRLVTSDANKDLVSTITAANLLASVTGTTGTVNLVFSTSPTLTTPVIGSFASANHAHTAGAGGGLLDWDNIWSDAVHTHTAAGEGGTLDHGLALTGLADDDHTQYALLLGRSGGQTLIGGTASGNDLTLQSTSNATKGNIFFGTSTYDEVNNILIIGATSIFAGVSTDESILIRSTPGTPGATVQGFVLDTYADVSRIAGRRANGTPGSESAVLSGQGLGNFNFRGHNGTAFTVVGNAGVAGLATENWSATANGTKLSFSTTPNTTIGSIIVWTMDQNGDLVVLTAGQKIDLSAISAGNPNLKITATSDVPVVTWTIAGTNPPSTAPAGYVEIDVGGNARYIPFWA